MKIGAVQESWLIRTPVLRPAVQGSIRRNGKPQLEFPLSNSELKLFFLPLNFFFGNALSCAHL
jgi:hypothetical protein